jgi:predicted Zn-dependent protease
LAEDILKWTFGHELGHAVLGLADVSATESIMNYSQGWTDHRLRYKPLPKKYKAGTENQWETISR